MSDNSVVVLQCDPLQSLFSSISVIPERYTDILREHSYYSKSDTEELFNVKVLSNLTLTPIIEMLELSLVSNGINAHVEIGQYDNIVQESALRVPNDCVIIFWELWNLFTNAQSKIESMSEHEFQNLKVKLKNDIETTVTNLKGSKLVLFNRFSETPCDRYDGYRGRFELLVEFGNTVLDKLSHPNLQLVDTSQIHKFNSKNETLDLRFLYKAKSIYSTVFFRHYVSIVSLRILKLIGKIKKVLVLDCDNTLWKGVLGEDGPDNIDISITSTDGSIFNEVQWTFKSLKNSGALLCLSTKNNNSDIQHILDTNDDLVLKREDLVDIAANWEPKSENILRISNKLNLGLDSFVFVDDSDFEINLMKKALPQVLSLKVPQNLNDYPAFARSLLGVFENSTVTDEDKNRTAMYQAETARQELYANTNSLDDFLLSLKMKLSLVINPTKTVARLAQMTQKTNQFNLTTMRMTEGEVSNWILSDTSLLVSASLQDVYGDSGVTGACFIKFKSLPLLKLQIFY